MCLGPGASADTPITGISIDTRSIAPGELFVALVDQRDGHEFLDKAFEGGACAALVHCEIDEVPPGCAFVRVENTLRGLERVAQAARSRMQGRVAAITGSVGKTGSKEALRHVLAAAGTTHAPEKSFNNHWGVPLTLARMPADTAFGVFEIGMNHPGEITPLSKLVRPEVAMITTVAPVHLGAFDSVDQIADAKAEIFDGLEPGGVAVLNRDNAYFDHLSAKARDAGAGAVIGFGVHTDADARLVSLDADAGGSRVVAAICGQDVTFTLSQPGRHHVLNALGVLAVVHQMGADIELSAELLSSVPAQDGRGAQTMLSLEGAREILLIDESYNANPASMRAAFDVLGTVARDTGRRSVAILGDMLELGETSPDLHAELADALRSAGIDRIFASGPHMMHLYERLPAAMRAGYGDSAGDLVDGVMDDLCDGDVVMVKGSLGSRMGQIVTAIRAYGDAA